MALIKLMRDGMLSNPYELQQDDLGRLIDWFDLGRVQKSDIGKRIYLIGDIIQMENTEQRDNRKGVRQ